MGKALIVSDKKKILLRDEHPSRITTVIPTSKLITYKGVDLVVVPHDIDEVKVLNNLGYDLPSPVGHYYKWSGRYAPFPAQKVTVDKLTLNKRMFVLNQIGTGKSLSALWAYDFLLGQGRVKRMLMVTPLSTMERVWADEVFHHFPHLTAQVLYGTAKRRLAQLEFPADIYILNHDGVKIPEIRDALLKRPDIDIVVVDEIAAFRNASTDRFKALKAVSDKREYMWGLTGTPIPNSPTDAWAQCRLVVPHKVPPYFGRFRELVERKVSQFKWVPRDNALDVVMEAMQPSVLFRRDECIDLPPTMYEHRHVELSAEQLKAYKQMMSSLIADSKAGQITAVNEAVKAARLLQIACLGPETQVLTRAGWKNILSVGLGDQLWDGRKWVWHGGVVERGVRKVVRAFGVDATSDHEVLCLDRWVPWGELVGGHAMYRGANVLGTKRVGMAEAVVHEGYVPFRKHLKSDPRLPKPKMSKPVYDLEYLCAEHPENIYEFRSRIELSPLPAGGEMLTYDILNAGDLSRFTIATNVGPIIVHNCGVGYDPEGNCVSFDAGNRLEVVSEIVEQAGGKVIVFVPLLGALESVRDYLGKKYRVEVVHGGVSKAERDRIFSDFQSTEGLCQVLVAHPKCMSHGLTLVQSNTIIWFTPTYDNETYEQANGRITRPGQKRSTFIVHIEGSEIERRVYKRLQEKGKVQGALLDMIKEEQ